jgi:hypothetical protein
MKTNINFWSHLAHFFLEWEMFQTKIVEKIKTHILCSVTFFRYSWHLWDNVKNIYIVEGGKPQMKIRRTRTVWWISKAKYIHTLRLCNTHCFSTITMFARTCFSVTLHVHWLSCLIRPTTEWTLLKNFCSVLGIPCQLVLIHKTGCKLVLHFPVFPSNRKFFSFSFGSFGIPVRCP